MTLQELKKNSQKNLILELTFKGEFEKKFFFFASVFTAFYKSRFPALLIKHLSWSV